MAAQERGDEDLVFPREPRQLRQGEFAFQDDVLVRQPHPLHHQGGALGEPGQFLPIFCICHHQSLVTGRRYLIKSIFQAQKIDFLDLNDKPLNFLVFGPSRQVWQLN
jgi:hypothetical protein